MNLASALCTFHLTITSDDPHSAPPQYLLSTSTRAPLHLAPLECVMTIYSNDAETKTANDAEMLLLKDGADAERVITAEEDGADA